MEGTAQLGYPTGVVFGLGVVLLACTLLYAIPRTSVLGAVLLTGYLGGAIATHVRVGNPLFSHVLFPVYLGVILWGASTYGTSACGRCCYRAIPRRIRQKDWPGVGLVAPKPA